MHYVDGFVIPVPKKNMSAYKKMSTKCAKIWKEYGAISYVETVADDVKKGKVTSFPRGVKMKPAETVVFSWITYESRKERDRINKAVMADPRIQGMMDPKKAPFDGKRMIFGGFKSFIEM